MTKIQNILLILTALILVQCQTGSNNSEKTEESHSNPTKYFENNLILKGVGESGIASFYLDWNIHIVDNDSIIMLSTLKKEEKDVRLNNRQYFGKLIKSEKYTYEIKVSKFFRSEEHTSELQSRPHLVC